MQRHSARRFALMLALSLGFLAACETTLSSVPLTSEFDLTRAEPTRAWKVVERDALVGTVVRFDDLQGPRFFYSVRNTLHQELGLIDLAGRAYRFRAHQPEPSWVGTGPVLAGVREILGTSDAAELHEVEISDLIREVRGPEAPADSR